jgi:hypothetical protein
MVFFLDVFSQKPDVALSVLDEPLQGVGITLRGTFDSPSHSSNVETTKFVLTEHDGNRTATTRETSGFHDRKQLGFLLPVMAMIRKRAEEVDSFSGGLFFQFPRLVARSMILSRTFNTCSMMRCSSIKMSMGFMGNRLWESLVEMEHAPLSGSPSVVGIRRPGWMHGKGLVFPLGRAVRVSPQSGCTRQEQKKADVAEHPEAFDHVGLLSNEPPSRPGCTSSRRPTAHSS